MSSLTLPPPRLLATVVAIAAVAAPSPGADDPKPTREAFLGEVLDAKPTPATPKFVDVPGSYHVQKEDLLAGLTGEAKKRKIALRAVLIAGPMPFDPLWTYYVTVFIREGEQVRVNNLVMPHARVTGKATGLIAADRYERWVAGLLDTGVPRKEPPLEARGEKGKSGPLNEFAYDLLLAVWDTDGKNRRVYYGDLRGEEKGLEKFRKQYNSVLKELKATYPRKGD
jgi:hypothetical protein